MSKRIEMATNIVVLLVALLVGFKFFEGTFQRPVVIKAGQKAPDINGYSWNKSRTLVLALKKGCHFCEESMPFYRRLMAMQQAGQLNAQIVAVFPDSSLDATEVMQSQGLSIIPVFSAVRLDTFKITGTPTVFLVDQNARIVKPWIGKQDLAGESDIIRTVGQTGGGALSKAEAAFQ